MPYNIIREFMINLLTINAVPYGSTCKIMLSIAYKARLKKNIRL